MRAFPTIRAKNILQIACEKAMFNLKVPFLKKLSDHLGVRYEGNELADVLVPLLKAVLNLHEERLLELLELRAAAMRDHEALQCGETAVMESDDAQDLLAMHDKKEWEDKKKRRAGRETVNTTFTKTVRERRRTFQERRAAQEAEAAAKGKGRGRGGRGGRGRGAPPPPIVVPAGALDQPAVKLLAPPGAYV